MFLVSCKTSSGNVTKFKKSDCRLYSQFQVRLNTAYTAYSVRPQYCLLVLAAACGWSLMNKNDTVRNMVACRIETVQTNEMIYPITSQKLFFTANAVTLHEPALTFAKHSLVRRKRI